MASFTCISCHVAFADSNVQRDHYKTDWHRYNLKRKVAELPPVSAENFRERVLSQRAQQASLEEDPSRYCKFCRKHFGNTRSFDNHIKSKKHGECVQKFVQSGNTDVEKQNAKNLLVSQVHDGKETKAKEEDGVDKTSDSDYEEVDDEEWEEHKEEALGIDECLFCFAKSENLEENMKHMTEAHSFFVPDIEFCIDLEGLITYLGEKVGGYNVCLWCNEIGKAFHSSKSAQQHMVDKGHCKMIHEGAALAEYGDFYDYSTSYPDHEIHKSDDEVETDVIDADGYELVLPSGATIGHRSLLKYYRQNLPLNKAEPRHRRLLHKVMTQYRALGWTGTTGEAAARKARDLRYMKHVRDKHYMQVGVKANKLQRHFRHQNPL